MGLDISHDTWHGAYSAFHTFRCKLAEVAGLPPLELMEGFYDAQAGNSPLTLLNYQYPKGDELAMSSLRRIFKQLPIKWECLNPSPLHELLYHSDCDGEIPVTSLTPLSDELEKLLPLLPEQPAGGHIGNWKDKTQKFIDGLRLAFSKNEPIEFR